MANILTVRGVADAAIFTTKAAGAPVQFYWNGPGANVQLVFGDRYTAIDMFEGDRALTIADARRQVAEFVTEYEARVERSAAR